MSGSPTRVMFYVQHLLGIGHLKRAATVVRAMEDAGLAVTLVSGGHEVPGLDIGGARLIQLAPMRAADKSFKVLVDGNDTPIDDDFRDRRRDRLLSVFDETAPHVLITELFPFGRRQLGFELLPLLDHAAGTSPKTTIVCSVRDILVEPPKPERATEMLERIDRYYDLVMVHGDPALIPFGETFPLADRIADRLTYTGYVVDQPRSEHGGDGRGEVIVSAGGGAVSEELFMAAMAARAGTRASDVLWRVLAGHALEDDAFARVRDAAPDGIVVERARPDFLTLLSNCLLSVSQGGYNTLMEVMATGARGVIVPYAGGLETEQTLRARLLGEQSGLQVLDERTLGPETIARAIDAALDGPRPEFTGLDVGGAEKSAAIVAGLARARHPVRA